MKHRLRVIQLLKKCLEINATTGHHYYEEQIHKLICPMRVTSESIGFAEHNLWLIDDRLSYGKFFASDQPFSVFTNFDSLERPDLVFFDKRHLMEKQRGKPAIILEFKRPARTNYSDGDDPITQIYGYTERLKGAECYDLNNRLITRITDEQHFYCYLVADITPKLKNLLRKPGPSEIPDGYGLMIRNPDYNATVVVVQYDALVEDAEERHQKFFDALKRDENL